MTPPRESSELHQAELESDWVAEKRDWNKQRGEIAHRQGRFVRDMVEPSVQRVVREVFGVAEAQIELEAPQVRACRGGKFRSFDVVTLFPGHALITESRARLTPLDVRAFVRRLPAARHFLPWLAQRKIVGAVASLYIDDSLIRHAERQGLVVMGLGEDLMEPKNAPGFVAKGF